MTYKPGQSVTARLLYRRSMLELYVDDVLYPVYAIQDLPGNVATVSVSDPAVVTAAKLWAMSLPGDSDPGRRQVRV